MSAMGGKLTLRSQKLELDLLVRVRTNVSEDPSNFRQEPLHRFREFVPAPDFNSEWRLKGIDATDAKTVIERIQIVAMPSWCAKLRQERRIEILW